MIERKDIKDYKFVYDLISSSCKSSYLLIGNGFSSALNDSFSNIQEPDSIREYDKYISKVENGDIFQRKNKTNKVYKKKRNFTEFYLNICKSHPQKPENLDYSKLQSCYEFLKFFLDRGGIFSLNYDFLPLWIIHHFDEKKDYYPSCFFEGFANKERFFFPGIAHNLKVFNIHGAFNFKVGHSSQCIRVRTLERNILNVAHSISTNAKSMVLVADTKTGESKIKKVNGNVYLKYCYEKFKSIKGNLVIYGVGFNENDQYLIDAIRTNPKLRLFFGVYDHGNIDEYLNRISSLFGKTKCTFFYTSTAFNI